MAAGGGRGTVSVGDTMTPGVVTIDAGAAAAECAKLMAERDIGSVGVTKDGALHGMLTDRDIVVRGVARDPDLSQVTVETLCTDVTVTVPLDCSLEQAKRLMAEHRVRRLFVIDGERPVGLLSADDVVAREEPTSVQARQIGEAGLLRGYQGHTGQAE